MRHDLESILGQKIPLQMITDSKSLFDVIVKNSTTAERCLIIDIKDDRESYESMKMSNVGFVRSENNPADAFTKPKFCAALESMLAIGVIDLNVEEWVVRSSSSIDKSFEKKKREWKSVCRGADKANDGYEVMSHLANEKHIRSINFSHVIGQ